MARFCFCSENVRQCERAIRGRRAWFPSPDSAGTSFCPVSAPPGCGGIRVGGGTLRRWVGAAPWPQVLKVGCRACRHSHAYWLLPGHLSVGLGEAELGSCALMCVRETADGVSVRQGRLQGGRVSGAVGGAVWPVPPCRSDGPPGAQAGHLGEVPGGGKGYTLQDPGDADTPPVRVGWGGAGTASDTHRHSRRRWTCCIYPRPIVCLFFFSAVTVLLS